VGQQQSQTKVILLVMYVIECMYFCDPRHSYSIHLRIHSYTHTYIHTHNSIQCESLLVSSKLKYRKLDGAQDGNKVLRNKLWGISKARTYPQVFLKNGANYKFCGDLNGIQVLHYLHNLVRMCVVVCMRFKIKRLEREREREREASPTPHS